MGNPRIREVFRQIGDCVLAWPQVRMASRLAVAVNRLMVELIDVLAEQQSEDTPPLENRRRTVEFFLNDLAKKSCQ